MPPAEDAAPTFHWKDELAAIDLPVDRDALARHDAQVALDLDYLNLPLAHWPEPATAPDGSPALSVLVVGAGMNGIAAAAALRLKGIHDVHILEQAPAGMEGPWKTTARMRFLRSVKGLSGPCLGLPSLTFRAWFTAAYGETAWDALYKIPNVVWVDYLSWLQTVMKVPVTHETTVRRLLPEGDLVRVDWQNAAGAGSLWARQVVLATGRTGSGGLFTPAFIPLAEMPDRIAHAYDMIDFERLRGRRIGIIGGASAAWDNAATALESGAAKVSMWVRRKRLPQVNRGRGIASMGGGFFNGWHRLPDAERWDLYSSMVETQGPPPHESVMRGLRHPGLSVELGRAPARIEREGEGVRVHFADGSFEDVDFLIAATGFEVDGSRIGELGELSRNVLLWRDRVPPEALKSSAGRSPYVGEGFELMEREPGATPGLSRIRLLNYGAYASHSGLVSDIPGIAWSAERLATSIAETLFVEQYRQLRARLITFEQFELKGTPFFDPDPENE